ncbi:MULTISPECIES: XRE family transcriptional regulator [Nocardia]|uniref:XRE family transcriptional regulator n=1 Tax=Nocardia TaxID=1817 RepID=UPI000D685F24|nr:MULTISPECIES: XRE family transcriptional regulator [Nocardia]
MKDPAVVALRDQLAAEIAEAINNLGEARIDTGIRLGRDASAATTLASGGLSSRFSLDALINYCAPVGLEVKIVLTGLNEGKPEERADRGRTIPSEPDHSASGLLRKQLIKAVAHQINTAGLGRNELAARTGIPATTLSALRAENIQRFRVDKLIEFAIKLGLNIKLDVEHA